MYNILNIMKKQYDKYERKTIFTNLDQFDIFAGENDFIEVCEWRNGEGVDIDINGNTNVSLSYGQLDAIKWCVKMNRIHAVDLFGNISRKNVTV